MFLPKGMLVTSHNMSPIMKTSLICFLRFSSENYVYFPITMISIAASDPRICTHKFERNPIKTHSLVRSLVAVSKRVAREGKKIRKPTTQNEAFMLKKKLLTL